jgi:hypothetical protein
MLIEFGWSVYFRNVTKLGGFLRERRFRKDETGFRLGQRADPRELTFDFLQGVIATNKV